MSTRGACALTAFLVLTPRVLRAEHFDIRLTAETADASKQEAFADESPPAAGLNPRPVLKSHAGRPMTIQFIMTNVYNHSVARNAGVRYYVVREQEIGQKEIPSLRDAVIEGSFQFDLKPKSRVALKERIVMLEPGIYLLRVESLRTQRDHEHFAAMDLVEVK